MSAKYNKSLGPSVITYTWFLFLTQITFGFRISMINDSKISKHLLIVIFIYFYIQFIRYHYINLT